MYTHTCILITLQLAGVVRPHPGTCLMGTATTVNGGQQYEEFDVYVRN